MICQVNMLTTIEMTVVVAAAAVAVVVAVMIVILAMIEPRMASLHCYE